MHIHSNRKLLLLHSMGPEYVDSKTVFARPAVTTDFPQLFPRTSNESISDTAKQTSQVYPPRAKLVSIENTV